MATKKKKLAPTVKRGTSGFHITDGFPGCDCEGCEEIRNTQADGVSARARAAAPSDPMVGQWFHTYDHKEAVNYRGTPIDKVVQYQGVVIGAPGPSLYLVQYFEWLMGEATTRELVSLDVMKSWAFYASRSDMDHSYRYGVANHYLTFDPMPHGRLND